MKLLKPKEIILENSRLIISKIPACEAFEISLKLPISAIPKIGDYEKFKATIYEILSYTGKAMENMPDGILRFTEKQVINNHIEYPETMYKLCFAMIEYNYAFFQEGRVLDFLKDFAQNLPQWISRMFADFLEQYLVRTKQLSGS